MKSLEFLSPARSLLLALPFILGMPSQLVAGPEAAKYISAIMLLLDEQELDLCAHAVGDPSLPDLGENPMPGHTDPGKMAEHMAIFDFVDYDNATHVAVQSGNWSSQSTWYAGRIPTDCAKVVIPVDTTVSYDIDSDVRLHTVRVDGNLNFSTSSSTRMVLDTLVVDPRGVLQIGTKANPMPANRSAEIVIADNGDINVQHDPMLLSRGVVAHGTTRIHGAVKTTHLKVASDPLAGQTSLTLTESPIGWRIGDKLVIAGTYYLGWKWDNDIRAVRYFGTQDEVRTIESIAGNSITLDSALAFDHTSPRADLKTSVANFTRNVAIRTENADSVAVHQRGHVMFMHSNKVDVRYAEFDELGRTDKSVPSLDISNVSPVSANSNVQGRYSFHFHRTGTADQRQPAVAVGNAVFGSPGWGYTHHDSHADFHDNASFNTFGAGFVAETGNETGIWSGNIAIKAEGNSAFNPKNGNDREGFDMGRTGDGFWFQGRLVRSIDNIAASVNHGFVYLHRGSGMLNFPPDRFMLPEALGLGSDATPDDAPIRDFDNNEAFANTVGLYIVKANPNQEHDIMTTLSDFTAWNVRAGAAIEYTSHYLVNNFDLIAAPSNLAPFYAPAFGLEFGTNTTDMVAKDIHINGFPEGILLSKHQTNSEDSGRDQFVVIGGSFTNVGTHFVEQDATDLIISNDDLVPGRFSVDVNNNGGRFEYLSAATSAGAGVSYTGFKTDSIGQTPVPAGVDTYGIFVRDMIANVEINGYYHDTDSGDIYTVVENYFSDRATGEIHKVGFKTFLGPDVVSVLGNQFHAWADAVDMGDINIASASPTAIDDAASTTVETAVQLNLTTNDTDPENDSLYVDGIVQPRDGRVFQDSASSVTYMPNFGFTGVDTFYYWVSDGNGNFSKGHVNVTVSN
ncbi:Ig-like domain-containing protein [Arenicella xantha]|uniref:G8 domain-containing protein n=1 Tax=Arenicella xantha TaxID=644221 RepID=A0A395JIJ7_9GAMM|nr:G8 domain-containing protein [Arenicella xantha]RBP50603.1 G8 domain-containing protein [Arenicella xantha]